MRFLELVNLFENREVFIEREADKDKFELDYKKIFQKFFKRTFKSVVYEERFLDLTSIEEANKRNFNDLKLALINENAEYRSLLYFKSGLEYLKTMLEDDITASQKEFEEIHRKQETTVDEFVKNVEFLDPRDYSTKFKKPRQFSNDSKVYIHSVTNYRRKKQKGDKSETKIYKYLLSVYGKEYVSWESRMNEGLHYDIRYSPDQGNSWIFVEAKTLSYDHFFMSPEEKEFGKKNSLNYEIWLVTENNEIKVLEGFFKKGLHKLTPNEYVVYIDL